MTLRELKLIGRALSKLFQKHPVFWFIEMVWIFFLAVSTIAWLAPTGDKTFAFIVDIGAILYHGALIGNIVLIASRMVAGKMMPIVDPRYYQLRKPDYKAIEAMEEETEIKTESGEVEITLLTGHATTSRTGLRRLDD